MKPSKIRSSHKSYWKTIYIVYFDHIEFAPLDDKGRLCFPYRQTQHSNLVKMQFLKDSKKNDEQKRKKTKKKIDLSPPINFQIQIIPNPPIIAIDAELEVYNRDKLLKEIKRQQ